MTYRCFSDAPFYDNVFDLVGVIATGKVGFDEEFGVLVDILDDAIDSSTLAGVKRQLESTLLWKGHRKGQKSRQNQTDPHFFLLI